MKIGDIAIIISPSRDPNNYSSDSDDWLINNACTRIVKIVRIDDDGTTLVRPSYENTPYIVKEEHKYHDSSFVTTSNLIPYSYNEAMFWMRYDGYIKKGGVEWKKR